MKTRSLVSMSAALLGILTGCRFARAQTIEVLGLLPSDTTPIAHAMSRDGRWVVQVVQDPWGVVTLRRSRPNGVVDDFSDANLDFIENFRITNEGRIFGTRWARDSRCAGEWTEGGFRRMFGETSRLCEVSENGEFLAVSSPDFRIGVYDDARLLRTFERPEYCQSQTVISASADFGLILGTSSVYFPEDRTEYFVIENQGSPVVFAPNSRLLGMMSGDGNVVVGTRGVDSTRSAFMSVAGSSDRPIAAARSVPKACSSDGRRVLLYQSQIPSLTSNSAIWSPEAGVRTFEELGFDYLSPWDFLSVFSVSADGRFASGVFSFENASGRIVDAIARFTLPPPCPLDYATDGMVDFFDYVAFVACFEGDCPNYRSADFNMDGFLDWADYAGFVEAFEIGC